MDLARLAGLACAAILLATPPARAGDVHPDVTRRLHDTGAPVKVWIVFEDKLPGADAAARDAALAAARAALPARTLRRRALRGTAPAVSELDLPVAAAQRAAVAATGATLHHESRWLDALSATLDPAQLAAVAALPGVRAVRLVARSVPPLLQGVHPAAPGAAPADGSTYGATQTQHELINLDALHALGHAGAGVVIGVLDTGFATTHAAFTDPSHPLEVLAAWDFVDNDANVFIEPLDDPDQHFHGTFILGELAASLPGVLVGAAWQAQYVLCKTEDVTQEVQAEEDQYVAGLEFAELHGADVCTSSLGYIDWYQQSDLDGQTAVTTLAVNLATSLGVVCCTAAGNSGYDLDPGSSHLIAPGDAFDVLTVGAVEPTWENGSFSSDGPTADGRVKPEIMAMGTQVWSVWPYDDVQLAEAAGTSTSTPEIAGLAACILSARPQTTVAGMRQRILGSGWYFNLPLPDPLFLWGWGVPDAAEALALAGTWQSVGAGLAGVQGVPQLSGSGSLVAGDALTLSLTQGKPGGAAFLVVGLSQLNAPFKGGTLVPAVNALLSGLPLDGAGALALSGPWSDDIPAGTSIWMQAWIPDAAAVAGFAASAGLKAVTP